MAPVRDLLGTQDIEAAYAVQRELTRRRLADGAVVVGRKIGLTAPAVQAQLGVDQPDFGVLFADMDVSALTEVPSHRLLQPKAKITPNTLARAYNDAGYFGRNVRTIEVLVDRDAVTSGAAASGEPWQYYDLGHGFCTYTFFEQCPHRMACARCDFYTPKDSSKGQLLEAKDNLQRMLASVPLSDEERAAVDDGQAALDQLLERLVDVPTPTGVTPREIGVPATATLLPIVAVNQGKS